MTDDFRTLMDSVGNMALNAVRGSASHIKVIADPVLRSARVLALTDEKPTDDEYDAILDRLLELRDFYYDELALSFSIERLDPTEVAGEGRSRELCEFAYQR